MGQRTACCPLQHLIIAVILLGAAPLTEAEIRIGVDWNGDGLIQTQPGSRVPVDAPTETAPFSFWTNHDQDDIDTGGETWPIARADGSTDIKDSRRDLEDFTRLRLEIDDLEAYPADALLELAWRNGSGGEFNLYRATDPDCSRSYLLDPSAGDAQLQEPALSSVGRVHRGDPARGFRPDRVQGSGVGSPLRPFVRAG